MRKRRSYEPGHRPKFLVVADDSSEFERALAFAARRAARTGAALVAVAVVAPPEAQPWLGVGDILREEAEEAANALLERAAVRVQAVSGVALERHVRSGLPAEEVRAQIDEDEDIVVLVLGAGTGKEGPGPLVSALAGGASANFPIPITIVPGGLSESEIEALA